MDKWTKGFLVDLVAAVAAASIIGAIIARVVVAVLW